MDLIITILPVVTKDLPISPRFTPYSFLSRCKFSTLTTRQPMVEFYLLAFPRFPLRKKEHKSYFGKNRTHDFRRCAGYLLDHSGDDRTHGRCRLPTRPLGRRGLVVTRLNTMCPDFFFITNVRFWFSFELSCKPSFPCLLGLCDIPAGQLMVMYSSSVQYTTSGSLPYILLFTQALTRVWFDVTIIDINTILYPLTVFIVVMLGYDWGLRIVINITCLKYQEVVLYLQPLNTLS